MSDKIYYVYSYPLLWVSMWATCAQGKDHARLAVYAYRMPTPTLYLTKPIKLVDI